MRSIAKVKKENEEMQTQSLRIPVRVRKLYDQIAEENDITTSKLMNNVLELAVDPSVYLNEVRGLLGEAERELEKWHDDVQMDPTEDIDEKDRMSAEKHRIENKITVLRGVLTELGGE